MVWKSFGFWLLFVLGPLWLAAQSDIVVVNDIKITGNQKTKDRIVYRELDFQVGDTIPLAELSNRLSQNQLFLMNTALFAWAKINIKNWDYTNQRIDLFIDLQEAWYIFPFPIFELADRNFNVWWEEQNRSLRRVNYGLRFYHLNTTGNKDPLKLVTQFGYTQKYELVYTLPPLNQNQTYGIIGEFFYARNREIAYRTEGNKLLFERREGEFPLQRFRAGLSFFYRPKRRNYHYAKIEYQQNKITDFVIQELNPNYFLDRATRQRLLFLRYEYIFDNRDRVPYAMRGQYVSAVMEKDGVGLFNERNGLFVTGTFAQYLTFSQHWSTELVFKGKTSLLRGTQPYNNYFGLGYRDDFLRGYELYVIDGLDYGMLKSSVRFKMMDRIFSWGKIMPLKAFQQMPLKVFLSINNDVGYVNSTQFNELNPLVNSWLWGGGIGIDFVVFYNKVIQFQYSINHLREKGLFLHYKLTF